MEDSLNIVTQFFITMISILNPIGAIPTYLSFSDGLDKNQKKKLVLSCTVAVFVTLVLSLLAGDKLLSFFHIRIPSFRIAGGILIGMNAFKMLQGMRASTKINDKEKAIIKDSDELREIGIVPLAIPMLAGPGAISTCIIYSQKMGSVLSYSGAVFSMAICSLILWIVLINASFLSNKLGKLGVNVMTRVMGLILLSISVEFIATGIKNISRLL